MKKIRRNNLILYGSLSLFIVVGCLFFVFLNYNIQKQSLKISDILDFDVVSEEKSEIIKCWYDEQEDMYYVFLPADAEMITVVARKGYMVEFEGVQKIEKINVADLRMNEPYNCNLANKKKWYKTAKVVFMCSQNIPALFVQTDSGTMQYINEQKGNTERGSYSVWCSDKKQELSGMLSEICGRGNTSWTDCEKKGYKLVLQEPQSLMGLRETDTYVLIANARSNYLSNTIAFWLEKEIGIKNATQAEPVDLYFNGEYAGSYILCERIHVGDSGIDIVNLDEENRQANEGQKVEELQQYVSKDGNLKSVLWSYEPDDISGGYLIERDVPEYYADERCGFVLASGDHFVIKSPKYAGKNEAEYIKKYMQDTYDAISSADGYNPNTGMHYREYIDVESFAHKYALEEFLAFNDAGRSSAYYYKDQKDVLYAGPGWDFEGVFLGNSQYLTLLNGTEYSTDLYEKLWQHDEFQTLVKLYYNTKLKPAINTLINDELQKMQSRVERSVAMDAIRWNREDFVSDCQRIRGWIADRCEFIDEQWNGKQKYVSVKVKSAWENNIYIYLREGTFLDANTLPQYVRDGFEFGGWIDESNGDFFDFAKKLDSDVTLNALWISTEQPLVQIIVNKARQIVPEIIFIILFMISSTLFLSRTIRGGNKK